MGLMQELLDAATLLTSLTDKITQQLPDGDKATGSQGEIENQFWNSPSIELEHAQSQLIMTLKHLETLVRGPLGYHRDLFCRPYELMVFHVMVEFGVLPAIPTEGSISLTELSDKVAFDREKLARMLHFLSVQGYLQEPELDVFQHTFLSRSLATDDLMQGEGKFYLGAMHKASTSAVDYLREKPYSDTSSDGPFSQRFGVSIFDWCKQSSENSDLFTKGMAGIQRHGRPTTALNQWVEEYNGRPGTLVDCGGNRGHTCIDLAKKHPDWKFIVQDLYPNMFMDTAETLSLDLKTRVSFQQHSFFDPQPIDNNVRAWIIRSCLHNWSDDDATKIVRSFVPAMEASPETVLLINEAIVPAQTTQTPGNAQNGNVDRGEELAMRTFDMTMFVATSTKLRTEKEWRSVVGNADSRLKIVRIIRDRSTMAVMEVKLTSAGNSA